MGPPVMFVKQHQSWSTATIGAWGVGRGGETVTPESAACNLNPKSLNPKPPQTNWQHHPSCLAVNFQRLDGSELIAWHNHDFAARPQRTAFELAANDNTAARARAAHIMHRQPQGCACGTQHI